LADGHRLVEDHREQPHGEQDSGECGL
jgi:hypothetical protein